VDVGVWDLEYVLLPNFFDDLPLSSKRVQDNKLVYFILEDATQGSPIVRYCVLDTSILSCISITIVLL
jgi:hypothetical protein